jgi:5-formyltetrahydrofolate cyclo-ligase
MMTKKAIKKRILNMRGQLEAGMAKEMDAKINARLKALLCVHHVMVYLPIGTECDIFDFIRFLLANNVIVAVPVCLENKSMRPALLFDLDCGLEKGKYGILEPKDRVFIDETKLDAVIVPGAAFDKKGNRIGSGMGYYDRFLPKTKTTCRKIGVCYEMQVVDELIPAVHDFPMDMLVTEAAVYDICSR